MRSSRIRSDDACLRSTACGARAEDQALRLRRALRRQTELNRLQREFMLMAAHEFGTPLAIIDSQAQGLARRAERIAPDDLRRRLEKIRTAVARMNEMVQRSLAAFSSSLTDVDEPGALADPGQDADLLGELGESRRVEIDMPRLVGDTCRAYQELSSAHQIVQDLAGLPRSVWGDTSRSARSSSTCSPTRSSTRRVAAASRSPDGPQAPRRSSASAMRGSASRRRTARRSSARSTARRTRPGSPAPGSA
jgi:signal transduction histidine kinase